jgi:hypothetical protein
MSDSFGARLRRQREARGIDLVAVAEQTKIKVSLFDSLERDDVSQWPTGIFRRAFIRSYAHAIGLDEAETVREFLECHPEPVEPAFAPAVTSGDDAERANAGPHTRLRGFVGAAFSSFSRLRRTPPAEDRSSHALPDLEPEPAPESVAQPAAAEEAPAPESVAQPATADAEPAPPPPVVVPDPAPVSLPAAMEPDLMEVAELCTQFGRVEDAAGLLHLLERAAGLLHATGLIVWVWDQSVAALVPALAHGYPQRIVAQLPPVRPTASNATAAAFRSAEMRAIDGDARTSGALAIPLITSTGCAGVLAIELQHGREQARSIRAVATIVAAMLAQLIAVAEPAEAHQQAPCA